MITNLTMDNLHRVDGVKETGPQRVKNSIRRLSSKFALSFDDLRSLEELFLRLEATEKKLNTDIIRRGNTRDQIKLAWQETIKANNEGIKSYDATAKTVAELQVTQVVGRKAKLLTNLELAATGSLPALEALKRLVATYYADRVQETNSEFHRNQEGFKREFGIEVTTSSDKFNVRKLDALLVLDFKARGFNTGYYGIDTAVIQFIPILTRLLAGDTIDHVEPTHPLLASAEKGGYTKDQLQTILTKLVEYQQIDQQRRLARK